MALIIVTCKRNTSAVAKYELYKLLPAEQSCSKNALQRCKLTRLSHTHYIYIYILFTYMYIPRTAGFWFVYYRAVLWCAILITLPHYKHYPGVSDGINLLLVDYVTALQISCKHIRRYWTSKMLVRHIMSSVCLRLSQFYQLSHVIFGTAVYSAYSFLLWWSWEYVYFILSPSKFTPLIIV